MGRISSWMVVGGALAAVLSMGGRAVAADASAVPIQRPRAWVGPEQAPAPAIGEPTAEPVAPTPAPEPETLPPSPTPTTPPPTSVAAPSATPMLPDAGDPTATTAAPAVAPPRVSAEHGKEPALRRRAPDHMRTFSHRGFTSDLRIGTIGCARGACAADRHATKPGFRIDGFVGGNIRGWVDLGISGGWGTLGSDVASGTNVLTLYGLDPYLLQNALGVLAGQALGINLGALTVTDTKLRTAQAGPMLRVHFIPRGRFAAYVGTGVQYNLFRARYGTASGPTQLDFHGLAVPIEGGFGVHVLEHLALGLQFDYLWTWYAIANLEQGATSLALPVRVLDAAAKQQNGGSFRDQLPQFWTFALTLRARI